MDINAIKNDILPGVQCDLSKAIDQLIQPPNGLMRKIYFALFGKREANVALYRLEKTLEMLNQLKSSDDLSLDDQLKITRTTNLLGNIFRASALSGEVPDTEQPDEPIDSTFFTRWSSIAEEISEDNLGNLISKVLMTEAQRKNSVSLRTLDVVKNLTTQDEEAFIKASRYTINYKFIPVSDNFPIGPPELDATSIFLLRDAGLLSPMNMAFGPSFVVEINGSKSHAFNYHNHLICVPDKAKIMGVPLTIAGQTIHKVSHIEPDEKCLEWIVKSIKSQNRNCPIETHELVSEWTEEDEQSLG